MNELPPEAMGPKMLALRTDKQRRFVWLMACGESNASQAARDAGYSDSSEACKVKACMMLQNPAVLEALDECGRKVFKGLAPLAIRRAKDILEDPKHFAHARMIEVVLDRTGFGAKSEHKVVVEHTADVRQLEDLARRLAEQAGIEPERLIGGNVIEGEVVSHGTADPE